jgi:hypothetical protein
MPALKDVAEALDLGIKGAIAVFAFFIYGQAEKQANISETIAKANEKVAKAAEEEATSRKTTQDTNLVIVDKMLGIFADIRKECLSDDRKYIVHFLVEVNNRYNAIHFDDTMIGSILSAQRSCDSPDAKFVQKTSLGAGKIPDLTPQNIQQVNDSLKSDAPVQPISSEAALPDGYVAVGSIGKEGFRNFSIVSQPVGSDANIIVPQALLKARWSVYLRSNTENTETDRNPIRGIIQENHCVQVLTPYPGIRGQTWAAVKLVECS